MRPGNLRCSREQMPMGLSSYQGLLTPAFVTSVLIWGPGKTESRAMTYLDMWRSGTFLKTPQVSVLLIANTDCRMTEHSTPDSLGDNSWAQTLFTDVQKECATPPHIQAHHCTWLSFTRPSPALVLQATNAEVRRHGYEAIWDCMDLKINTSVWYHTAAC